MASYFFLTDNEYEGTVTIVDGGCRIIGARDYQSLGTDLHLRMGYSYLDTGCHTADYGAGVDRFGTSWGLFQVGIPYQF